MTTGNPNPDEIMKKHEFPVLLKIKSIGENEGVKK